MLAHTKGKNKTNFDTVYLRIDQYKLMSMNKTCKHSQCHNGNYLLVTANQEAEAGGSLELKSFRLA